MAAKTSSSRGLRVILFGTPGSGKSSLLGALWQAAQSQETLLGGKIEDASGGLSHLHNYVYEQKPEGNDDDLAFYPISVSNNGKSQEATLIDCDGEMAEQCLAKSSAVIDSKNEACRALLGADAILLVVDPTAGSAQIDKEFQQFGNFIHLLEKHRSQRNEVVGLPIYLVLTKCDAIAKPSDAGSAWLQKIEDGKKKVDKRFQDFLAKYPYRTELPFGKVDLHVWATSVKRPALADRSAKSQEPYGVAELFRRAFQSAREYHERRQKARSRLNMALFGYGSLIALMACAAAFFFAIRPDVELTLLVNEINDALPADHKEWLKEPPPFEQRLDKLAHIENNKSLRKLPLDTQVRVKDAQEEIKAYKERNERIMKLQLPRNCRSAESLGELEGALKRIDIPAVYQEAWSESKLVKKKTHYEEEIKSYKKAIGEFEGWLEGQRKEYYDLYKSGNQLIEKSTVEDRKKWLKEVQDVSERKFKGSAESEFIPNSTTITYSDVRRFQNDRINKTRDKIRENEKLLAPLKNAIEKASFGG